MEGWKDGRMEGWKDGRMEGWKDGRSSHTVTTVPAVRVFPWCPGSAKWGQVKSRGLILNSVFCFLTSVSAVRIEFEFEGD
jgi:hypothetical protein